VGNRISKAIFLDRDGTIVKEVEGPDPDKPEELGYLTKVEQVSLIEGSAEALAKAKKLGYKIIVITNQSALARGWLTEDELAKINNRMYELLKLQNSGAIVDDLFYSPYHTQGVVEKYKKDSPMRKPGIGMILQAKEKHNIDLSESFMIGDAYSDIKTGENAGLKNILVMTGYGKVAYRKCLDEKLKIDFIADNLLDAIGFVEKNGEK
jgi:D-glycero-D-manno-heptose 1,7-bisphosphate phosphatase